MYLFYFPGLTITQKELLSFITRQKRNISTQFSNLGTPEHKYFGHAAVIAAKGHQTH